MMKRIPAMRRQKETVMMKEMKRGKRKTKTVEENHALMMRKRTLGQMKETVEMKTEGS
jgi:hypothetical protein